MINVSDEQRIKVCLAHLRRENEAVSGVVQDIMRVILNNEKIEVAITLTEDSFETVARSPYPEADYFAHLVGALMASKKMVKSYTEKGLTKSDMDGINKLLTTLAEIYSKQVENEEETANI